MFYWKWLIDWEMFFYNALILILNGSQHGVLSCVPSSLIGDHKTKWMTDSDSMTAGVIFW